MNPKAIEYLNKILAKEPGSLTEVEIAFLRARRSYLKKAQLEEYDSILNPKETKPAKEQTVKENDNSKQTK